MQRYISTYALRYVLGFFIMTLVIRYLGQENFGKFTYVISLGALASGIAGLGLNAVVPPLLGKSIKDSSFILSNAFGVLLITGIFTSLVFLFITNLISNEYFNLFIIYSIIFPLGASQAIKYYYEIKADLKQITLINNLSIIISNIAKLIGVYFELDIEWFIGCLIIESLIIFLGYLILISKENIISFKTLSKNEMFKYVKKGMPFLMSSMMIIIYMKIDLIMLENMIGSSFVGEYAETIRLVEIFLFFPVIVQTTYFPFIVDQLNNKGEAKKKMRNQYLMISLVLSIISLIIIIFAPLILQILYNHSSTDAVISLRIYSLSLILIGLGTIRNHLVNYFELSRFYLVTTILGALINIVLNIILIPIYGIIGCAIATVISQVYVSVISSFFNKVLRKDFLNIFIPAKIN